MPHMLQGIANVEGRHMKQPEQQAEEGSPHSPTQNQHKEAPPNHKRHTEAKGRQPQNRRQKTNKTDTKRSHSTIFFPSNAMWLPPGRSTAIQDCWKKEEPQHEEPRSRTEHQRPAESKESTVHQPETEASRRRQDHKTTSKKTPTPRQQEKVKHQALPRDNWHRVTNWCGG